MKKIILYCILYGITICIFFCSFLLSVHPIQNAALTVIRYWMILFAFILLCKYAVYMIIAPWYGYMQKRAIQRYTCHCNGTCNRCHPLVSIMIPAWNEGSGLITTIKTILANTYTNIEIIVVNDGSTDNSHELMLRFLEKCEQEHIPQKIRYTYKENGGKGSALNVAVSLASGDILLSIDADCALHHDAIIHLVRSFYDPRVMAAVGNVVIGNTKTLLGTIQCLEYLFGFYFKKADAVMNTIYIIGGAAGAFRKTVFEQLGGYSLTNITEDIELSMRIQDMGWKIAYAYDAIIFTEGASSLKGLIKQRTRWKRGRMQTFAEHKDMFFSCKKRHNILLTWGILPLSFFGDIQLSTEIPFLTCMYTISILSGDFSSFLSGVIVVSLMFFIQGLDSTYQRWNILLAPIGWLLFYVTTYVEVCAIIQSMLAILRKKEVVWQKWQRKGGLD